MVDHLLAAWQDSQALIGLLGVMNACEVSLLLIVGNGNEQVPPPEIVRQEAADLRYAAEGVCRFYEGLADRIEARSN